MRYPTPPSPPRVKAAKKLVDSGRLPNIHCLFVGEGPDKQMLIDLIAELKLEKNATIFDFTKEPFYVFERCNIIALPSTGKVGHHTLAAY